MMSTRTDILLTATELTRLVDAGEPVTILDVRWELTKPDGHEDYLRGHIPGAVYVALEDELSDHGVPDRGRHPLPSGRDVEMAARRWGVREGVPVVVYDDWNRAGSARAWWVLTAAGIPNARILDGGWTAWKTTGGAVQDGAVVAEAGDVTVAHDDLYNGALPTLTADEVGAFGGVLLDARAPERFRGDVEPVDAVAGHVPGARNAPSTTVLSEDGTFLADTELVGLFETHGVNSTTERVGVYCGSGITAAVALVGLTAAGVDAALFPGSWSQWSSDSARPVARGRQ